MFRTLRELNRLKPLIKVWITLNEVIHSSLFFIIESILNGSIIFGVGDSHTSFIWNKK